MQGDDDLGQVHDKLQATKAVMSDSIEKVAALRSGGGSSSSSSNSSWVLERGKIILTLTLAPTPNPDPNPNP